MEPFITHPVLQTDRYAKIFLYTTQNDVACVPRHTIHMKDKVLPKKLQEAVKTALMRFPHMMLGIEAKETRYEYRILNADPVVLPFDGERLRYSIGSKDTNGYMFLVGYQGNKIYMEYQHSISDGRGFEEFIKCVLYHYLKLCGCPVENDGTIRATDSAYVIEESEDAYRKLDGMTPSSDGIYKKTEALHADALQWQDDAPEIVTEITFTFHQLRDVYKKYQVTPLSILAPVFSRAFFNKFDKGEGKPVISQIPVDLRQFVPSMTTRYFICFIDLPYEAEWNQLPLPEVFHKTKDFLDTQMQEEQLLFRAKQASDTCRTLHESEIPLAEKEQKARKATRDFVLTDSFLVTNVGRFDLPACMQPYVTGYGAVLPCGAQPFALLISSYDGMMRVSIAQRDHNLSVVCEVVRLLESLGIDAKMESYPYYVTRYSGKDAANA